MKTIDNSRAFWGLELILLIALVFVVLFPYSPLFQVIPSRDSGVFLYTGWRVAQGEIPYLQIWDHKPPVIYYLDAIGLLLSPSSTWGVWCLEVVSLLLSVFFGYRLTKRVFGYHTAVFVSTLWLFTCYYLLAGGNLTEEYALPFQFIILWLFYKAENKSMVSWYGFSLGFFTSILFFTRQTTIAIPLAVGLYVLGNRLYRKEYRLFFMDALVVISGGVLATAIILGYFAINKALPAFWDTAFLYNFAYTDERTVWDRINALLQGLNQLESIGLAQIAFCGWGASLFILLFNKERINPESRPLVWLCILALPLEFWMVSLGGRPRVPYFLALLPVMSILAGFPIWLLIETIKKDVPSYAISILLILLVLSLWSVFYVDYSEILNNNVKTLGSPQIIKVVKKIVAADDFVLFWGAETTYNFLTRRASPSRYVYQTPLYNLDDSEAVTEFLQKIIINKPRLIILRSTDRLSDFRFGYRDNQVGALMDQIKANYKNQVKVRGWIVYTYSGK